MFPIDKIIIWSLGIMGACTLLAAIWWAYHECKKIYQHEKRIAQDQRDFDRLGN